MTAPDTSLTPAELELLDLTATLWNKYLDLPDRQVTDGQEMQSHIQAIQCRIMARLAVRRHPDVFRT